MKPMHLLGGLLAAATLGAALPAAAAGYPEKPVTVVVSFPPGNSADLVARTIAEELSKKFGQPFVADNKGGAGGIIGVDHVVRAPADGYTISITSLSPITVKPAVEKISYDPFKQLKPISLLAQGPMVIVVKKDSPFNSVNDLIAYAKANPGKLNHGSLGTGTISQLTTELFLQTAKIKTTEIPYKGSGQAMVDLIGGQIDYLFDGNASAMAQMRSGNVKALAVTTPERSPLMPDTPSLAESGIPGFKDFASRGWMGAFAPAGTPQEIVNKLHAAMQEALKSKKVVERFNAAGLEAIGSETPAAFGEFTLNDYNRWRSAAQIISSKTGK